MTAEPDHLALSAVKAARPGPPPLPFALTVGVTGHRLEAIPAAMRKDVETRIAAALGQIEAAARRGGAR